MAGPTDNDLDAALPAAQREPLAGAPLSPAAQADPDLDRSMTALGNMNAAAESKNPNPAAVAAAAKTIHAPTRFQQSVPASPSDRDKWAATPWSEVGKQALHSAIPSTWEAAKSIGHAVAPWNWGEDANAISSLAKGAASKAGMFEQDAPTKAKNEAVLDALMNHYGDTYGTMGGFKKALATDPASLAMDASTFAGGAGAAAKAAQLPKLARAASVVSRAVDPISNAVRLAKAPLALTGAAKLTRGLQGLTTGAGGDALKTAALAGSTDNPALRDAYWRHFTGKGPSDEPLQAMADAFEKLRGQQLDQLAADKRLSYANAPGALPFNKIDAALAQAKADHIAPGAPASWKADKGAAIQKVEQWVNYYKANPQLQTMQKFDDLRKEIGDLGFGAENARIKDAVAPLYGAVRSTMEDVSPEYTRVLERTTDAQRELKDMARSLGVTAYQKGSAMSPTLLARQMRAMVTGRGRDLMQKISKVDPRIPYMLAGVATHEFAPQGLRRIAEMAAAAGSPVALVAAPEMWAPIVGGATASFAAASPKVAGAMHYGIGSMDRVARSPAAKAAYYAGRADDELSQPQPPATVTQGATFPALRNARNNNWGNLKDGPFAQAQPGYAGTEGSYAKYDSPEKGADATKALLTQYLTSGRNTPSKIVDSWAPKGGENTEEARAAYKARIARAAGVGVDDPIPLTPESIERLFHGVANSEGSDFRTMRASGGRTGIDHVAEAGRLIRKAEQTKNALGKATQPLLNASDDHIAKALATANESI